ncbi:1096_t:CDS:2 [Acaulospora morrowiae]|uniref:1096_t:CDS:1 n=1 Tax=Acaulospora morrowiae TaxID=94023 RepID=A0A9N8V699_9GLOM|nr:1096_t:CDS:2 [Acaulospora morrowiae]
MPNFLFLLKQSHLPPFGRPLGSPKLRPPLFILRALSLVPASYCFISFIVAANQVTLHEAGNLTESKCTELDYWLGAMWWFIEVCNISYRRDVLNVSGQFMKFRLTECLLAGLWSYWLADGLMRRWIFHYEVSSAIIRLISLQAINWVITAFVVSHYGSDEPVMAWVVCSIVLAFSNAIQWLYTSPAKYQKIHNLEVIRQMTWKDILKYIVIPLAIVAFFTMMCLLEQQSRFRYAANFRSTNYKLNYNVTLSEFQSDSEVKVIMIVLSSWKENGYRKRKAFRDTSIKLIPSNSNRISVSYRFILGNSPSAKVHSTLGQKILAESDEYGDIIIVPSSDLDSDLSHKLYKAFEWANEYDFNYIIKTDDDVFVRMDIISRELEELGSDKRYYWRGLGYWNIPPSHDVDNKNSAFDYKLPLLPPFTAGVLYILSRDIISLIVTDAPRLFTKSEDQNLGVWLFPYNIKPIHDKRIQKADVCEDDMIAKHFGDSYEKDRSMQEMYENVVNKRRLCEGFRQRFCAFCYPCWGREDHWKDLNFDCDGVKGITLLHQPKFALIDSKTPVNVFDSPLNITMGGKDDEWIIPGLLSRHSSVYSNTDQWYLLHWVFWMTDSSTFQERHYKAIELVWVHTPNAIVFVLTNTLPDDFFTEYKNQGYQIYVIKFNKDIILDRQWFLGQNSKNWIQNWIKTEFIGSDISKLSSDFEWTLDAEGTYLAPGIMRFRKGRSMFREIAELAFSLTYITSCFNCAGPRAITMYIKQHRDILEKHGLTILPGRILYPRNYLSINELFIFDQIASRKLEQIVKSSWTIHLFGKMTNTKSIGKGSVIDLVTKKFTLDLPHASAPLVSDGKPILQDHKSTYPFVLEGPKKYQFISTTADEVDSYAGSLDGKFQGLDVIFVRGGPVNASKSAIVAKSAQGKLSFNANGGYWSETSITINNPTKKDVNSLLNTLVYRPSGESQNTGGKDTINLEVTFGEHYANLTIEVVIST